MSERERRRAWIAFGIALVAITIFRVLLIHSLADRTFFGKYFDYADALRAGTIPHDRIPDLSPGYLWTIALLRALGAGVDGVRPHADLRPRRLRQGRLAATQSWPDPGFKRSIRLDDSLIPVHLSRARDLCA